MNVSSIIIIEVIVIIVASYSTEMGGKSILNVNCLKSGCSSLAKGKQIKEMCLQPRPITLKFF